MHRENTLVIDIGSGSTGAALVKTDPKGLPEILYSIRTPYRVESEPSRAALEAAMLPSLHITLASVVRAIPTLKEKGFKGSIGKALIAFSSPWLVSFLKTVIVRRDEGFVLDEKALRAMVKEEEELLLSRLKESSKEEYEIFESVVTSLFLNGYATPGPISQKIKRAEASFLVSAGRKSFLWKVENELIRSVGLRRGAAMHSFMYAYFKVLSHAYQDLHSALLINMTSEMTDILFMRHGESALFATLSFGPAAFARAVAMEMDVPLAVAYSYLSLLAEGDLDEASVHEVEAVISDVGEKWKGEWQHMAESVPEGSEVPYSVFVVVPPGFEKLMKTFLERVIPGRRIVLLGETNVFTKELVKAADLSLGDEKLLILTSFSNLLA